MKGIVTGMKVTLSNLFAKPVTRQYPKEKPVFKKRFRGRLGLVRDKKSGRLKCVACGLCAKACPDNIITIVAAQGDPEKGEKKKYPKEYTVDIARCMYCGYCVEACPFGALVMTHEYELATYNKDDLVCSIDKLIVDR
ncbi:MAG: NuoI/complex I 23 kDa subunit family protein [bacterium]